MMLLSHFMFYLGSKPIVQIHKSPNITHYGSTVKITCDASGSPTPNIDLWFKVISPLLRRIQLLSML